MKRKALFVGVANYRDDEVKDLQYTVHDVVSLVSVFSRERFGFETHFLLNPRKDDLRTRIDQLHRDLRAGDMFLFFFAGHGFSVGGRNRMFFPEDRKSDLIRGNESGLECAELVRRTNAESAEAQYDRVFLFDMCRSYLANLRGMASKRTLQLDRGGTIDTLGLCSTRDLFPHAVRRDETDAALFILHSCSMGEESLEIPADGCEGLEGNGLFSQALSQMLSDSSNKSQSLSLDKAFCAHLSERMKSICRGGGWEHEQAPECSQSGRVLDLLLARTVGTGTGGTEDPGNGGNSASDPPPGRSCTPEELTVFYDAMNVFQYLMSESAGHPCNATDKETLSFLTSSQQAVKALQRESGDAGFERACYLVSDLPEILRVQRAFAQWRNTHRRVFLVGHWLATLRADAQKLSGTPLDSLARVLLSWTRKERTL